MSYRVNNTVFNFMNTFSYQSESLNFPGTISWAITGVWDAGGLVLSAPRVLEGAARDILVYYYRTIQCIGPMGYYCTKI